MNHAGILRLHGTHGAMTTPGNLLDQVGTHHHTTTMVMNTGGHLANLVVLRANMEPGVEVPAVGVTAPIVLIATAVLHPGALVGKQIEVYCFVGISTLWKSTTA